MLANSTGSGKPGRLQKKIPGGKILYISPLAEDHAELKRILAASPSGPETSRPVCTVQSLPEAVAALKAEHYAVVICEGDLGCGSWKDALDAIRKLGKPPLLIVSSMHADEYLWAEALNLGAYDVLAKPFSRAEVTRVVDGACLRWANQAAEPSHSLHRAKVAFAGEPQSARILVVDDDETMARLLSQILRLEGFDVMGADSAVNALSLLEETGLPVDLLISDVQMPFIDGVTLAKMLQEKHPACRVLLISGSAVVDPAVSYPLLMKPFDPPALTEQVRRLLFHAAALRMDASHDIHPAKPSPVVQETFKMSMPG
jgi:DNA-binding NtrC family response regulator